VPHAPSAGPRTSVHPLRSDLWPRASRSGTIGARESKAAIGASESKAAIGASESKAASLMHTHKDKLDTHTHKQPAGKERLPSPRGCR
jgi:hypothetical protein